MTVRNSSSSRDLTLTYPTNNTSDQVKGENVLNILSYDLKVDTLTPILEVDKKPPILEVPSLSIKAFRLK